MGFIRNLLLIVVLPLLGLIAALLFIPPLRIGLAFVPAGLPMVIGALWGAFAFIAGWWMGLRRFRFLGWFIILAGIAIGVWQILSGIPELSAQIRSINFLEPLPEVLRGPLDELLIRALTSIGLLTLSSGIGLSVMGLITFLRYRKDNPVPYREEA
jgi:hypothetical protein